MMRRLQMCVSILALCAGAAFAPAVEAQQAVGVNAAIRNSVQTRSGQTAALRPAQLRAGVRMGDQFVTGAQSQVQVLLNDRSTFTVGANARMTVDRFVVAEQGAGGVTASVARGAFRFASGRATRGPSRQAITTPVASIGVRGTIVEGLVGPDVLVMLRGQPGVPAFTGDEETLVLVVLRGPGGGADGFDTPGEVDVEREGVTVRLDQPGMAALATSDGLFGPFFLSDSISAALVAMLLPLPDSGTDSGVGEGAFLSAVVAADDSGWLDDALTSLRPLDGFEPPFTPGDDRNDPDFPFFPPPRPGP